MLIFNMLYYCGLRKGELLGLDWDDIDMGKDTFTVRSSKNKTGRIVPIHPEVKGLLDAYLAQRLPIENRALFVGERGNRMCMSAFTYMMNTYLKISGLKNLPPEIGKIKNLTKLNVSTRYIEVLPPEIGKLKNLKHLDISNCKITSLPPEIWDLKNLISMVKK